MFVLPRAFGARAVVAMLALLCASVSHGLDAQTAGELRGRVTVEATGRAIPDARVVVSTRTDIARTSETGSYIVRGLEPRSYTVLVQAVGFGTQQFDVDISNGRTVVHDVALRALVPVLARVDVRGRSGEDVGAVVISRAQIAGSGKRTVAELLQGTPGVVVTQAGGPGQPARVSLRGAAAAQTLVTVDGVPQNSAVTGEADLSLVSLANVERVTVHTGAASARYGARAAAGVIAIESRNAGGEASIEARGGALGERELAASLGTAQQQGAAGTSASLSLAHHDIDGDFRYTRPAVRGGGSATRINADASSTSLVAHVTRATPIATTVLRGTWEDTDRGMAGSIIQPSATGRQHHDRVGAGITLDRDFGAVALALAADASRERARFADHAPPFGAAFDDTLRAAAGGASLVATVARTRGLSAALGVESRVLNVGGTSLDGSAHSQTIAGAWAHVSHQLALSHDLMLTTTASARADHNSLAAGLDAPDASVVSPRIATALSRRALTFALALGSGYAPPSLADQFFHEGVQTRANPSLRAERTRHDAEARLTLARTAVRAAAIDGTVAVYRADVDGMILWFPDFRFIWSPGNYDVHRRGAEASGSIAVPRVHTSLGASFSRNAVTYADGGLDGQVAYRPRDSGGVELTVNPSLASVRVATRYIGARRTVVGSALNALDPYWMSDVTLSRTLTHTAWSITTMLGVENVLGTRAAMLVDYPFPPRTWSLTLRVRRAITQSH